MGESAKAPIVAQRERFHRGAGAPRRTGAWRFSASQDIPQDAAQDVAQDAVQDEEQRSPS